MNPDYYERICTAVENKFGTTPTFVRSERMLSLSAGENPVVIISVDGRSAAVQVPDAPPRAGVDRLLGDLEAKLFQQEKLGQAEAPHSGHVQPPGSPPNKEH